MQPVSAKNLRKLLLKFILRDGDIALNCFVEWEKQIIYDDLDFRSFKLLPAVYQKLFKTNINGRLLLRIKGAYRRTWAENQLLLNYLDKLFSLLKTTGIKFFIADENIRLTEIYHDPGIFSLQNFSIVVPFSDKNETCCKLSQNLWEICSEELGKTEFKKDKSLHIQFLWISDEDFSCQLKNVEEVLVKDKFQPVICPEEQVLNLCANEFQVFDAEESRWQFIVSALFQAQKINTIKLIELARKRNLAHQLTAMLQKLSDDFEVNIPANLMDSLRKIPKSGKLFLIRQKIHGFIESYQLFSKYEHRSGSKFGFLEFLAKRWKSDSSKVLFEQAIRSGIRLLQTK